MAGRENQKMTKDYEKVEIGNLAYSGKSIRET